MKRRTRSQTAMPLIAILICLSSICLSSALAQPLPEFEAASVKPAQLIPGQSRITTGGPGTADPGRITYTRGTLLAALMKAYGLDWDRISGPKWIDDNSNLFDITATMSPGTSQEQFQRMLQNLLAQRFHLKLHHETKMFPGYDLVVAKTGLKLKETSFAPGTADAAGRGFGMNREGMMVLPGPGSVAIYRDDAERMACAACAMDQFGARLGNFVNMSKDAAAGSPVPVISDKTGLTGKYDFALSFACLGTACHGKSISPLAEAAGLSPRKSSTDPVNVPTLFIALEKQTGLSLEKTKDVPVDVLVIDSVDARPTEN